MKISIRKMNDLFLIDLQEISEKKCRQKSDEKHKQGYFYRGHKFFYLNKILNDFPGLPEFSFFFFLEYCCLRETIFAKISLFEISLA